MAIQQQLLFKKEVTPKRPPSTRYQGSKLKLLPWIWAHISSFDFDTALDAFGGTASVSYMLKSHKKQVTYNDHLKSNHLIGTALIENASVRLSNADIEYVITKHSDIEYDDFITRTFGDIYFTDEENAWLDVVAQNIPKLKDKYKRAIAYYALFQSCIIKRPYNLFHRKNLYIRTADVNRGFGNKATWDKPFNEHFLAFIKEANQAIFDAGVPCKAVCYDALCIPGSFDLVYIDTPYISKAGSCVDYFDFYHFLEGLVDYTIWDERINFSRKHHPLKGERSPWSDPKRCHEAFAKLFDRYREAILVVSYRSDGIPSEDELINLMRTVKSDVQVFHFGQYKYVLSKNGKSQELLLIGR